MMAISAFPMAMVFGQGTPGNTTGIVVVLTNLRTSGNTAGTVYMGFGQCTAGDATGMVCVPVFRMVAIVKYTVMCMGRCLTAASDIAYAMAVFPGLCAPGDPTE